MGWRKKKGEWTFILRPVSVLLVRGGLKNRSYLLACLALPGGLFFTQPAFRVREITSAENV